MGTGKPFGGGEEVARGGVADLASLERRAGWQDLSRHFPGEIDCLASFLALELAEVLQDAKPASLVCLANKRRSCGKNPYQLWKKHGAALLAESGVAVRELADRGESLLLLLYSPPALASLLATNSARSILSKSGYSLPGDLEATLDELQGRVAGEGFPHEIGVFLGYPLKDVVGFLGWAPLSFTCQGPWKIYGDPAPSLRLAEAHRACRSRVARRLASGCSPLECLRAAGAADVYAPEQSPNRAACGSH